MGAKGVVLTGKRQYLRKLTADCELNDYMAHDLGVEAYLLTQRRRTRPTSGWQHSKALSVRRGGTDVIRISETVTHVLVNCPKLRTLNTSGKKVGGVDTLDSIATYLLKGTPLYQ